MFLRILILMLTLNDFSEIVTFCSRTRALSQIVPFSSIVPFCPLHDFKRSFQKFLFRSFTNHSNIFQNAFYAFVLFRNVGIVLDCSVLSCERTIDHQEKRPALVFSLLFIGVLHVVHYTTQILKFNFLQIMMIFIQFPVKRILF